MDATNSEFDLLDDSPIIQPADTPVHCEFITGAGGTGKTYMIRERFKGTKNILAATTGIAAVNLGTVTINSILKYFNTESLTDLYFQGRLQRLISGLIDNGVRELAIDEISMLEAPQLDLIYRAIAEVNSYHTKGRLALILTGDFCQLPPINGEWAFNATCWPEFAANTTKLTKPHRQSNVEFLNALNLIRSGDKTGAEALRPLAKFAVNIDDKFLGTTIVPTNKLVDRYNLLRFDALVGEKKTYASKRWGKTLKEWDLIPESLPMKIGAYVMILANAEKFEYANGDTGTIESFEDNHVIVRLLRNNETVEVTYIDRQNTEKNYDGPVNSSGMFDGKNPYYDKTIKRYVLGGVDYLPLRLAYAATVHKTQGLTLDRIQVDIRGHFFGSANMAYVAMSRVKTPEGLRIIGNPELLARRINIDPLVKDYI